MYICMYLKNDCPIKTIFFYLILELEILHFLFESNNICKYLNTCYKISSFMGSILIIGWCTLRICLIPTSLYFKRSDLCFQNHKMYYIICLSIITGTYKMFNSLYTLNNRQSQYVTKCILLPETTASTLKSQHSIIIQRVREHQKLKYHP